jgi:hypothetical protein
MLVKALRESNDCEKRNHAQAIARLQAEMDRLQRRIDTMYIDKLDGKVDDGFFNRMKMQWGDEQERCQHDIERHIAADDSYMDEGVQLLRIAKTPISSSIIRRPARNVDC